MKTVNLAVISEKVWGVKNKVYCIHSAKLDEFTQELQLKGRSETTIYHYCLHARLFIEWIQLPPRQVSASDVRRYLSYLYNNCSYALETIKLKIRSVKRFYEFLFETGQVFINPCVGVKEPKGRRTLPKSVLSPEEMESILRTIPRSSLVKLRDRAIIAVLYSTALRLSELTNLQLCDLNLCDGLVRIQAGKGGTDRQAILDKSAVKAVSLYLALRKTIPDDSSALWINFRGEKLSKLWIQIMIRNAAEKAAVDSPVNPHAWRHGLATALLRRGASIREVQVFLGHKTISSTQVYTHLTIIDLKEIHRKTHPREFDPTPAGILESFGGAL